MIIIIDSFVMLINNIIKMEKIKITSEFKNELQNLNCQTNDDFITLTRINDGKAFFNYGRCKLHITKQELDEMREWEIPGDENVHSE